MGPASNGKKGMDGSSLDPGSVVGHEIQVIPASPPGDIRREEVTAPGLKPWTSPVLRSPSCYDNPPPSSILQAEVTTLHSWFS